MVIGAFSGPMRIKSFRWNIVADKFRLRFNNRIFNLRCPIGAIHRWIKSPDNVPKKYSRGKRKNRDYGIEMTALERESFFLIDDWLIEIFRFDDRFFFYFFCFG